MIVCFLRAPLGQFGALNTIPHSRRGAFDTPALGEMSYLLAAIRFEGAEVNNLNVLSNHPRYDCGIPSNLKRVNGTQSTKDRVCGRKI